MTSDNGEGMMDADRSASCDALFKALGDGTRRRLLEHLVSEGEQSVHALTAIADVSQPMVSRHMAKLKRAGLVTARRAGRETFYAARVKGLGPAVQWMAVYGALWSQRFAALGELEAA
ncbi:MAG: metalloregulator ArsR/SmtB family transcription factor [Sphingobium sp.]